MNIDSFYLMFLSFVVFSWIGSVLILMLSFSLSRTHLYREWWELQFTPQVFASLSELFKLIVWLHALSSSTIWYTKKDFCLACCLILFCIILGSSKFYFDIIQREMYLLLPFLRHLSLCYNEFVVLDYCHHPSLLFQKNVPAVKYWYI